MARHTKQRQRRPRRSVGATPCSDYACVGHAGHVRRKQVHGRCWFVPSRAVLTAALLESASWGLGYSRKIHPVSVVGLRFIFGNVRAGRRPRRREWRARTRDGKLIAPSSRAALTIVAFVSRPAQEDAGSVSSLLNRDSFGRRREQSTQIPSISSRAQSFTVRSRPQDAMNLASSVTSAAKTVPS